eukprot:CAMPEP_0206260428 /NCGR_PEP_ID=MMETSP0047_2-20121206/27090_1 /ASSEMBLY_ACC=CAM_ASM_000192 /TAXON_ID=195065 /ORGANISM="Chroomonas mesostigmatica_cf, Strain CCMP1168" /LENGTH=273 /DNA_ID=CAMNT_0053687523 /DNA_START=64 /DNA_END=882 /DNA_ORIENTATION=-
MGPPRLCVLLFVFVLFNALYLCYNNQHLFEIDEHVLDEHLMHDTDVRSLRSRDGVVTEKNIKYAIDDSVERYREKLRERDFQRMQVPDAPWVRAHTPWIPSPLYPEKTAGFNCNPLTHSCGCFDVHLSHGVCNELAHRQKPLVKITSGFLAKGQEMLDCPSVRCLVHAHDKHAPDHSAYVAFSEYKHHKQADKAAELKHKFPKSPPAHGAHVLISREPREAFWQLRTREFFARGNVSVTLSHPYSAKLCPNCYGASTHIDISAAELVGPQYRR